MIPNASAEIYECNGIWTNRPCAQNPSRLIPEVTSAPEPTAASDVADAATNEDFSRQAEDTKKASVIKLIGVVQRARRENGLEVDAAPVETLCESPATPPETCVQASEALVSQIEQRITEDKLLKLREQEVNQDGTDSTDTDIVVVQQGNNDDYRRRRRRRPIPPPYPPGYDPEPTPYPPAQERTPTGLLPLNTTQLPLNTTDSVRRPRR